MQIDVRKSIEMNNKLTTVMNVNFIKMHNNKSK